jgi:serine/threonine protein kinase
MNSASVIETADTPVQAIFAEWDVSGQPDTLRALERHPTLREDKSCVLDLAAEEYVRRAHAGENIDADEFCAKFPNYPASIRHLIESLNYLENEPHFGDSLSFRWPEAGESFGGYLILRRLGRGGFARAYLAHEPLTGRDVVLKVSPTNSSEPKTLARFKHDNVIPILHAQVVDGAMLVVAMPYIGASTLEDLIDLAAVAPDRETADDVLARAATRNGLPVEPIATTAPRGPFSRLVLNLARELAEGLAHLHAAGIQHRDLKPSNVVLSWQGRPVIVDFNLSVDTRLQSEHFGGTLRYMAPEQISAGLEGREGATLDQRADLFSLGVILYELLTNRHPFGMPGDRQVSTHGTPTRELAEGLLARQRAGCRLSGPLASGADPGLERIILECLEVDPAKRPPSAQAIADELARLHKQDPRRERRRSRLRVAAVALACVISVAVIGSGYYFAARPPLTERRIESARRHLKLNVPEKALEDLDAILKPGVAAPEAYFMRGLSRLRLGDYDGALVDFLQARRQAFDPNGATSSALVYCYAKTRNYPAAVACAEDAIDAGGASAAVFNNRAASRLMSANDHDRDNTKALADLDEALKRDAGCMQIYHNRANVFHRLAGERKDPGLIRNGIEEIRTAESLGLHSMAMYQTGSGLLMLVKPGPNEEDVVTALRWLRRAVELGYDLKRLLHLRKMFAPVMSRPEFRALEHAQPGTVDRSADAQLIVPLEDLYR